MRQAIAGNEHQCGADRNQDDGQQRLGQQLMAEQPERGRRQIVLKRSRRVEEVDARNRTVDDVGGERDELEVIVVKLQLEKTDQK